MPTAIPHRDRWVFGSPKLEKRLSRLMNYPGTRYAKQMMETVCYPAMEEWRRNCGCAARTWS
ncbi:hypothetical protein ACNKHM_05725 [Shigella sonnei]